MDYTFLSQCNILLRLELHFLFLCECFRRFLLVYSWQLTDLTIVTCSAICQQLQYRFICSLFLHRHGKFRSRCWCGPILWQFRSSIFYVRGGKGPLRCQFGKILPIFDWTVALLIEVWQKVAATNQLRIVTTLPRNWCLDRRIWDPRISCLRKYDKSVQAKMLNIIVTIIRLWSLINLRLILKINMER